jgi:hypothetical protein
MGTAVHCRPAATVRRPAAGLRSVTAGALARLASIAGLATIVWPDGLGAIGVETLYLPILAVTGLLLSTGAVVAHHGRHDRPSLRLFLVVANALGAWAVPSVLIINLALVEFAVTEPGEFCHDAPCRDGLTWTVLIACAALASVADALLSTIGSVRVCRRLPAGALRRSGWAVLTCGALLTAAGVIFTASRL